MFITNSLFLFYQTNASANLLVFASAGTASQGEVYGVVLVLCSPHYRHFRG